jgi:hypothetical protein
MLFFLLFEPPPSRTTVLIRLLRLSVGLAGVSGVTSFGALLRIPLAVEMEEVSIISIVMCTAMERWKPWVSFTAALFWRFAASVSLIPFLHSRYYYGYFMVRGIRHY